VSRLLREVTERHIPPEEAAEEEPPPEEAPQTPAAPDETPAEAVPAAGADEAGGEDEGEETDEEIEQIRSIEIHDVMLAEEDAPSESTAPPDEDRDDPADEETT